ncbi:6,7-dimethyl-8-ribityllumazine synthase [Galactobacter valiniphilus]|uniref:6,7-dimethyl-8-ribityllumazine synthase n=1 Tax=Galactobacter valiniphilus TaxID=2676122 RepID=UPI001F0019A1
MSGAGAPFSAAGGSAGGSAGAATRRPPRPGFALAVLATRWNADIVELLVDGALRAARDEGIEDPRVHYVDGALELPLAAARLAGTADAVVALGAVIEGETPHFEHVCRFAVDGLGRVGLDTDTAIGNGVLTCHTREQALARSGGEGASEDKGYEAARAAIDLAGLRP